MVTINRKLGNGFIFNPVDSSKDQEHYFSGAKKVLRAQIVGATAQADNQNISLLGSGSGFRDIAVSSSGRIYVVGNLTSASINKRWCVISSSDAGATWAYSDLTGGLAFNNSAEGIAISPVNGKIFVCGMLSSSVAPSGTCDFVIRSSSDGGQNWGTVLRMHTGSTPSYGGDDFATCIATHPTDGNIVYCAGVSMSSSSTPVWKTVKSADGGASWFLVDSYSDPLAPASSSVPHAIVVSSSGLVIAAGGTADNGNTGTNRGGKGNYLFTFNASPWIIRTSSDGGTTWGTVDYDQSLGGTSLAQCNGLHITKDGKIIAVGSINTILTIKTSSLGGATGSWYTVFSGNVFDSFSTGHDVSSDFNGNLIVTGYALSSSTTASFIMMQSRQGGARGTWNLLDSQLFNEGKMGPNTSAIDVSGSQFYYTASSGSAQLIVGVSGAIGKVRSLIDVAGLTSFTITGSEEVYLLQELRDSSNSRISTGSFIQQYFGLNADVAQKKMNPYLTFKVSSSLNSFNDSEFLVEFRDENSAAWSAFKDVKIFGNFYTGSDGYMEYRSLLISGSKIQEPVVKFLTGSLLFKITTYLTSTIYAFKDFKLEFDQPIPDGGVEKYKTFENQNLTFENVGYNFGKIVG